MEFKGTKGPWVRRKQEIFGGNKYVSFACNFLMDEKIGDKEALANAQLISKAPEMLEMLIKVLDNLSPEFPDKNQTLIISEIEYLIKEAISGS